MSLLLASPSSSFASASVSQLSCRSKVNHEFFMKVSVCPRKPLSACRANLVKCFINTHRIRENVKPTEQEVCRSDFPADFMFGASSSALQTEGINGGKGESTWDMMIQGTTAIDSYHKYKDDVAMLKNMSANCYRFSIAWTRIVPTGKVADGINQEGIDFYNNLINELIANGIKPFVTMFHCDLPTALDKEYNGYLGRQFVDDFKDYAELLFKHFGDRVKFWSTFNEPQVLSEYGYKSANSVDDPARHPYIVAHHLILAHATAAKLYKEKYQASQGGEIGLPLVVQWFRPRSDAPHDRDSARRAFDFLVGWYLAPLVTGDYPFSMRAIIRDRLPQFTEEEKALVKGSYDFITINYYTSRYAQGLPIDSNNIPDTHTEDQCATLHVEDLNGVPIGPLPAGDTFAFTCPAELKDALLELKNHYENPKIYISENGIMESRDDSIPLSKALRDPHRIEYIKNHLKSVRAAIQEGVNVKGYCIWSLLDSMELGAGYTVRMGLTYIDYLDNFKRIPKDSAKWYGNFIKSGDDRKHKK